MTAAEQAGLGVRRRTLLAVAISAAGLAAVARAQVPASGLVDLQVVDRETGQPAQVWRRGGRIYVAGQPGARYSLRVRNNSAGRVLVVMSVDGVNIITGETAGYGQRGYIFGPYDSYDVDGWRKSDDEVAAFTFAPLPQSYAARTGRPGDVGVIGIAAFTERVAAPVVAAPPVSLPAPPPPPPIQLEKGARDARGGLDEVVVTATRQADTAARVPSAKAAPSAEPAQRSEKLGTGHGAREWSHVTTVAFERATTYPQLIQRIEYDSYDNLVASGVIPRPRPRPAPPPRPFPSSPDRNRYVPDPPGWR